MILLGLGSNLPSSFGDRFKNINLAISYLEKNNIKIVKKSSYYETLSFPDKKKPKFINTIIAVDSDLSAEKLASIIISIEEKLERKRNKKNDPRTCDIDIIDFNGEIINFKLGTLSFNVPHEKLIYRNFVLYPLQELFPHWKHPKNNELISNLINRLSEYDKNSILKIRKS